MAASLQLKIHPALAAAALRCHWEAALAMWTLARALDPAGRGLVADTALTTMVATLGLSRRQVRRWLAQAQRVGLLTPCPLQRTPHPVWRISGLARVARWAELPCLSGRPVWLPASVLRGCQRWRAWLWAAWLTGQQRDRAPMARATMAHCTGIPASTQRVYERATGVAVTRHYAVSDEHATPAHIAGMRAEGHAGAFGLICKQCRGRPRAVVAWPLPNTYATPLVLARRGHMRRVNRQLRQPGPSVSANSPHALLTTGDGHRQGERRSRVFYPTRGMARTAARHACATGPADAWGNPSVQTEWYYRRARWTQRGARLWGVMDAAG